MAADLLGKAIANANATLEQRKQQMVLPSILLSFPSQTPPAPSPSPRSRLVSFGPGSNAFSQIQPTMRTGESQPGLAGSNGNWLVTAMTPLFATTQSTSTLSTRQRLIEEFQLSNDTEMVDLLMNPKLDGDPLYDSYFEELLNGNRSYANVQYDVDMETMSHVAMLSLIMLIVVINCLAIITLAYGIKTPVAPLTIRTIYFMQKRTLPTSKTMKKTKTGSNDGRQRRLHHPRHSSDDHRRFAMTSKAAPNMDCSTFPYLLSLAISDLFIGIIIAPLQFQTFKNNGHWEHGPLLCDLWRAADIFFCTCSALHTAVIAVDRWWALSSAQGKQL